MCRVAEIVGPAQGTNLAETVNGERKSRHVPKEIDRIFVRVQSNATLTFVDTDARASVSATSARSLAVDCRSELYLFLFLCL